MAYKDEIIKFSIEGFKRTKKELVLNDVHLHVLKNKHDNFFGPHPNFKFHRWAGSLKSSQAFAYNIFSGISKVGFEYDMWALDKNPLHKACIDVAIENENNIVRLYEVKMFEFANSHGKNKIFHKLEHQKYLIQSNYEWNTELAGKFISFIHEVQKLFTDQPIYGEGIKQLCCHLLGIINEMTITTGKLLNKKVELYSLCFDNPFTPDFKEDIENYENALLQFKSLVDKFLEQIEFDTRIKYHGFLPASEYIKNNSDFLGLENYNYVMNRYF